MSSLLMWAYCHLKGIEFSELDTGVNSHKWVVLAAYLLYVLLWLLLNRYLELFLRQRAPMMPALGLQPGYRR